MYIIQITSNNAAIILLDNGNVFIASKSRVELVLLAFNPRHVARHGAVRENATLTSTA